MAHAYLSTAYTMSPSQLLSRLGQDKQSSRICINAGALPPVLVDGSVLASECFIAMACSTHREIAFHNFNIDFFCTL